MYYLNHLPIPLLDRDKSFDVEGISLYEESIWDYVNLVEGTSKADDMTRVGRWMSEDEYAKMIDTGYVQESYFVNMFLASRNSSKRKIIF